MDNFWKYVTRGSDDECWIWTGSPKTKRPTAWVDSRVVLPRVASYRMHVGEVPAGYGVTTTCANHNRCVNPKHLSLIPLSHFDDSFFWAKVEKGDGCWLWTGSLSDKGYGICRIAGHAVFAHRHSYEINVESVGDACVLHRCDNPRCVRPDHLFLGTQTVNVADMDRKGRRGSLKGSRHPRSKLSEWQIQEIRRRRAAGETGLSLAREFGVCPSTIVWIVKGRHWRHVG